MINYFDNENSLLDCLKNVDNFEIILNGEKNKYLCGSEEFKVLLTNMETLFSNSRLMPAFGVSLHGETQNGMRSGAWIKINFNRELNKNGLPFSALIYKLEETQGFNLIREFNGKYDGRCLYLDLDEKTNLMELINFKLK